MIASRIPVATALLTADRADPELAAEVVRLALARLDVKVAQSVLCFFSEHFAWHCHHAVTAAAKAARCLQVAGCTAPGIFTEEDWALDRPAVCAMVFAEKGLVTGDDSEKPLLSLASPSPDTAQWLETDRHRFGLMSTDSSTQKRGCVFGHSKVIPEGRFEGAFQDTDAVIGTSMGLKPLTPFMQVTASDGYDLVTLDNRPALQSLMRKLPLEMRRYENLPLHLLYAAVLTDESEYTLQSEHKVFPIARRTPQSNTLFSLPENRSDPAHNTILHDLSQIDEARLSLVPIIGLSGHDLQVTLAARLSPGTRLFWATRTALAAEQHMRTTVTELADQLSGPPDFAVMFSCMGRGPYFFDGHDKDLDIVTSRFPNMPLIGAYGSGEIAPHGSTNSLIHNAVVLGLFRTDV